MICIFIQGTFAVSYAVDKPAKSSTQKSTGNKLQANMQEEDYLHSSKDGAISAIRYGSSINSYRLVFDVDKIFQTKVNSHSFPYRISFDLPRPYNWKVPMEDVNKLSEEANFISGFRYGNFDEETFRVVIDLTRPIAINRAFLLPSSKSGDDKLRFVLDLSPVGNDRFIATSANVLPNDETILAYLGKQNKQATQFRNLSVIEDELKDKKENYFKGIQYPKPSAPDASKVIVTIDPGHGGTDPGATVGDIYEKDIVLNVSKKIVSILNKTNQISTVMTRDKDHYVPLADRALMASYFNSSVFVSIHADKARTKSASGMSVYHLSQRASDAESQMLASTENLSDVNSKVNLSASNVEVSKILRDLSSAYNINASIKLSSEVVTSSSNVVNMLKNSQRSANFVVLRTAKIPSILVEIGFLSNDEDLKKLTNEEYVNNISAGIARGIIKYLVDSGKVKGEVDQIMKSILPPKKILPQKSNTQGAKKSNQPKQTNNKK